MQYNEPNTVVYNAAHRILTSVPQILPEEQVRRAHEEQRARARRSARTHAEQRARAHEEQHARTHSSTHEDQRA